MTPQEPRTPLCRCGHPAAEHPERHAEMCMSPGCPCFALWLVADRARAVARPPTLRDLIAAGKSSPRIHAQRLASRIEVSIPELLAALRKDKEREAQRLYGSQRAYRAGGNCDVCGQPFRRVAQHKRLKHGANS